MKSKFGKKKSTSFESLRVEESLVDDADGCSFDDDIRDQPVDFGEEPPSSILGCFTWFMDLPEGQESLASQSEGRSWVSQSEGQSCGTSSLDEEKVQRPVA